METELKNKIIKLFEKQFPIISKMEVGCILLPEIKLWTSRDNVRNANYNLYQKNNVNINKPLLFLGFDCNFSGPYFCKFLYENNIVLIYSTVIENWIKLKYLRISK